MLWPMMKYSFTKAFVEGYKGKTEVVLKEGVSRDDAESWCKVSNCQVKVVFKDKGWYEAAEKRVCETFCHWHKWQRGGK